MNEQTATSGQQLPPMAALVKQKKATSGSDDG